MDTAAASVPVVRVNEASPVANRRDTLQSSLSADFVGLYNFKQTIGRGHFGIVRLAEHALTREKVAVKIIDKSNLDAETRDQLYKEVKFMKLLKHPHIISLYEVCETPSQLYLILELADGGDLFEKVTSCGMLPEDLGRDYFRQILSAVLFCHSLNIAHRDIKPENVLLVGDVVKVSDFGMSSDFLPGDMLGTAVGSLAYSAPEILLGDMYYGESIDVWSLGVTLYMLVCGHLPFDDANPSEMVVSIMEGEYTLESYLSEPLRNLLRSMLEVSVEKRIKLHGVAEHPWVTEDGLSPMMVDFESEQLTASELSSVAATLSSLKIDYEQVKKDIADNVHNYSVATFHLLRLQKIRERTPIKRMSRLNIFIESQAQPGMTKSSSSEDAQGLKNSDLLQPHNQPLRTQSAETMQVMEIDLVQALKKKDQPISSPNPPSPAVSPYEWKFGARRKPRNSESGISSLQTVSLPGAASLDTGALAAQSDENLVKALAMLDQLELEPADIIKAKSRPPRPVSAADPRTASQELHAPLARAMSTPGFRSASAGAQDPPPVPVSQEDVVVQQPASRLASLPRRATFNRPINLISEESGEDDPLSPRPKPADEHGTHGNPAHQLTSIVSVGDMAAAAAAGDAGSQPMTEEKPSAKSAEEDRQPLKNAVEPRKTKTLPAKGKACVIA